MKEGKIKYFLIKRFLFICANSLGLFDSIQVLNLEKVQKRAVSIPVHIIQVFWRLRSKIGVLHFGLRDVLRTFR